jgi:phosphate ABC transporter phosphate-binding protein
MLALVCCRRAPAQTAETMGQVKKVYVESFGKENGAGKLRERTMEQLRQKARLEVVAARNEADAVVKGNGAVWVSGYFSPDPRSPSNARQPVLHGFLSLEVVGKDGEPLWSYLVTHSKWSGDIAKDLAERLVDKLAAALEQKNQHARVPTKVDGQEVALSAAGSTFPAPLYQKWFELFEERHRNVHIAYRPMGSEAGLELLLQGKVDFATSDLPPSEERMAQSNKTVLHFASVVGAVVPVYNLKGVKRTLNFTPEVLAGIFLGKIRKWNDPAIREANRSATLPDTDIAVVHRSDGSGTTFIWTDYLSKLSPEWKATAGAGSVIDWPVGMGREGNESVASTIAETPNSISYVEYVYALRHQLSFGAVRNRAGLFIEADLASVAAAAADAGNSMGTDSQVSITNAPAKGAYPIASFTWWVWSQNTASEAKRTAFRELLGWMLSSGQQECSALGYAPLPREVANRELKLLAELR